MTTNSIHMLQIICCKSFGLFHVGLGQIDIGRNNGFHERIGNGIGTPTMGEWPRHLVSVSPAKG